MDPETWRRLQPVLDRALELSGEERARYVETALSGDPRLRAELKRLLAADAAEGGLLDATTAEFLKDVMRELSPAASASDEDGRLVPGTVIAGRYRIVAPVGRGGMGEVYRAHDGRLHRDVALKVVPGAGTPDQVQRLEREALAAGALNHPNIVAVHDVGTVDGTPYVVSELLEGATLRHHLAGPLPFRKALEYGVQIARGLAAAHDKGIGHRDIKPENLFLTRDGTLKILDFGLAKRQVAFVGDKPGAGEEHLTATGAVIGTAAYMSPEQARGEPTDHRSDIFSFGAVLYEMLTGRRAFRRATRIETMNAVLKEDPVDPLELNPSLSPAAVAAVRRCLEKNKEGRFQSAQDLAFHLQQLESATGVQPAMPRRRAARHLLMGLGVGALTVAAGLVGLTMMKPGPAPTFQQVTFHRGRIGGARFASQAVVYSQAPVGGTVEVWLALPGGPESRSLGYTAADVLAARSDQVALSIHRRPAAGRRVIGTLAVAPLGGGAPREVLEDVEDADWDPWGQQFAVAHSMGMGAGSKLEYPIGHVRYESAGSIHSPRVSGDGQRVAFLEDLAGIGTGGRVVVTGRDGGARVLTRDWGSARGLAWSPRGSEIWFTAAADEHAKRALRAVDLQGHERLVLEAPGSLTIWDAAPDGRVLLARDDSTTSVLGLPPGASSERDLSWFDSAALAGLSRDGRLLLFYDRFGVYLRGTDGSPPVKLALEGALVDDLSADGRFVLATSPSTDRLVVLPTGAGASRSLPSYQIKSYRGAMWFPDGRRILFNGREEGRELRSYVMDLSNGPPRPLTPEGTWTLSVSPDGELAAAISPGGIPGDGVSLWPIAGGSPRRLPNSEPGDRPVAWTSDGGALWIFRRGEVPAHVYRLDVTTGNRRLWKTLAPPDPAGVHSIVEFRVTPSGHAYFYSFERTLSQLYVARWPR